MTIHFEEFKKRLPEKKFNRKVSEFIFSAWGASATGSIE
jgi:hypothetical protein